MNIRFLTVLSLLSMLSASAIAAGNPFIGHWKLRPDRSRFLGFQEKIEDLGGYKYKFTIGDRVETIVLDGEDHPSAQGGGATWALKQIAPNQWKSIDKVNGQITAISVWTVSNDGRTFTSVTRGVKSDGSRYRNEFTARRVSGKSGLVGTWVAAGPESHVWTDFSIQLYQGDGLSLISGDGDERIDLKFDGKEYPDVGPDVPSGSTVSAKYVSQRAIELAGKVNGKLSYLQRLQVSDDGRTLALGVAPPDASVSAVYYYDRR
jgi:hypothetical protein